MNKKALVITYHVKNCMRIGGFHSFIKFLEEMSYDIDWLTSTVSVSWLWHCNDRTNIKNFFSLWRGMEFEENGVHIRHFAVPLMIPAKIACALRMQLGDRYWPPWESIKKKLGRYYDLILVEGVGCQYADELRSSYPEARMIYRPSDILETFMAMQDAIDLERNMIEKADITLCVDENQKEYYKNLNLHARLSILRNPLTKIADIEFTSRYMPPVCEGKKVIYIGVSFFDNELVEYVASKYLHIDFLIIGPFENKKSHGNIKYLGSMSNREFEQLLKSACVAICPIKRINKQIQVKYGYTKKVVYYMKYLLPIVANASSNYLNINGFYTADNIDNFVDMIGVSLDYTHEDRLKLRKDYLKVMELFLEDTIKNEFTNYVNNNYPRC